jgi:N-acetyl-gamma-glutamyl-phosphate reductase
MRKKIFIDGSAGTTGLRIRERLQGRADLELLTLAEELRKDPSARRDMLNSADVAFLCLPDAAAKEAVTFVENDATVVIDTSTAHRTSPDWAYGFPELEGYRQRIASSKRIANPGCHASGFIALIEPLIRKGLLTKDVKLAATSLTGFSGGGKKMIADYAELDELKKGARQYALSQSHKHLPEISAVCGLETAPAFMPIVAPHYSGMEVSIPVFAADLNGSAEDIKALYKSYYGQGLVKYVENADEEGFLSSSKLSGRDDLEVSVYGNDERILLVARFDNLGKGASGAAIENMNIVIGVNETTGLVNGN